MNENKTLVSIVIPIYNSEKYLSRCIDSVLAQTYSNLEIILVNDGSTDNSYQICTSYQEKDKRIKILNKKNGGLSDARNEGISKAKGDYIYLLDSDDYIDFDCIEILLDFSEKNKCDMVISDGIYESSQKENKYINEALNGNNIVGTSEEIIKMFLDHKGLIGSPWTAWGKLYKRELFKEIRYPVGRVSEDLATTPYIISVSNCIGYVEHKSYHYVLREGSLIHQGSEKMIIDNYYYLKELRRHIYAKYPNLKRNMDIEFAWMAMLIGLMPQCSYDNCLQDIIVEVRRKLLLFMGCNRSVKYKLLMSLFVLMPQCTRKLVWLRSVNG